MYKKQIILNINKSANLLKDKDAKLEGLSNSLYDSQLQITAHLVSVLNATCRRVVFYLLKNNGVVCKKQKEKRNEMD